MARKGGGRGSNSIKLRRVYDALRRKGYSKEKSARISNAMWNGTLNRRRGRRR